MHSNWSTTYNDENKKVEDNRMSYSKTQIPDWFKSNYHTYHRTNYQGENIKSIGVYGDKPFEKFFDRSQEVDKLYSDNYNLAAGTTKATGLIPGYSGNFFI